MDINDHEAEELIRTRMYYAPGLWERFMRWTNRVWDAVYNFVVGYKFN